MCLRIIRKGRRIIEFTGKRVVITGGERGMGRKFVEDLSALGAKRYMLDGPDSASAFGQG